jgi:hypothetical protein
MIKDLENALIVINWMGKEPILAELEPFKGKFRKLFLKGFAMLKEKYEI